jgi:pilus assembly protein Flp/PilA
MLRFIRRLVTEEDGPTAVEYAVMLALIVGVCFTSINALADRTGESFDTSAAELSAVLNP